MLYALGGSTNGVLHLLSLAYEYELINRVLILSIIIIMCRAEVKLSIEDFNRIGSKVPLLSNLKPHGKVM